MAEPHILLGVTSPQTCLVLHDRMRALRADGFRVSVVSGPGGLLDRAANAAGVSAHTVSIGRSISPISDAIAFAQICILLQKLKPDIVEFSTPKMGLLGTAAAWVCGVKSRVYFLRGLRLETCRGIKRQILLYSELISALCASAVLCNSRSLMFVAASLGIAPRSKMTLLGSGSSNGVDVARFRPGESDVRGRYGIPQHAKVVGFVGRLTADKGLPELLEAFALVLRKEPETYLLLVGWFDAAEDLLKCGVRARVEGHPRIVLTGYVADVAPYYRAMDVLVLPSWREGFPNVVLEAAASGIPVVATACTGTEDAVEHGVTGALIPPGDPALLANSVRELLADHEMCSRMGARARQMAMERFESGRVLGLTVRYYESLLNASACQGEADPAWLRN